MIRAGVQVGRHVYTAELDDDGIVTLTEDGQWRGRTVWKGGRLGWSLLPVEAGRALEAELRRLRD